MKLTIKPITLTTPMQLMTLTLTLTMRLRNSTEKSRENQTKITDYCSKTTKESVISSASKPYIVPVDDTTKEVKDQSKGTITEEEENLEELYKSLTTENNLTKAKDATNNQSTTFFEDNHYKIHEKYPSIFEKGGYCDKKDTGTPTRILKPPSSFSTPKLGTPKRSRSESPENTVNGIKTIKFSPEDDGLLDMDYINPTNTIPGETNNTEGVSTDTKETKPTEL